MQESFELPVFINNEELNFPGRLLNFGYSYKLEIDINGAKVLFEPDEERNWRAMLSEEDISTNKNLSKDLLQAIISSIEKNLQ
jgi:hypothetical protein